MMGKNLGKAKLTCWNLLHLTRPGIHSSLSFELVSFDISLRNTVPIAFEQFNFFFAFWVLLTQTFDTASFLFLKKKQKENNRFLY